MNAITGQAEGSFVITQPGLTRADLWARVTGFFEGRGNCIFDSLTLEHGGQPPLAVGSTFITVGNRGGRYPFEIEVMEHAQVLAFRRGPSLNPPNDVRAERCQFLRSSYFLNFTDGPDGCCRLRIRICDQWNCGPRGFFNLAQRLGSPLHRVQYAFDKLRMPGWFEYCEGDSELLG